MHIVILIMHALKAILNLLLIIIIIYIAIQRNQLFIHDIMDSSDGEENSYLKVSVYVHNIHS